MKSHIIIFFLFLFYYQLSYDKVCKVRFLNTFMWPTNDLEIMWESLKKKKAIIIK